MMHALILGLVIAILILILIQKTTSGFTAAECDAKYTLAYKACRAVYDKANKDCGSSNQKCQITALRAREACQDSAQTTMNACMGGAAAEGDQTAVMKLRQNSQVVVKQDAQVVAATKTLVTPGSAITSPAAAPM